MGFKRFRKAVIVGPGLIGGSIGINLRQKKLAEEIVGVARRASTLKKARQKQSIDRGSSDVKKAVVNADLVILATPVWTIKSVIVRIKDILKPGCIVFDVGSTKREIVSLAEKVLPAAVHFVGTHPLAGSEKAGAQYASRELFKKSICFVTRTKKTSPQAFRRIRELWRVLGAEVVVVTPVEHDTIVAEISHLPHIISVVLVDSIRGSFLDYVSTGFKDTTRIAAGAPALWRDISFSNKYALFRSLGVFEKKLANLKKFLRANKTDAFMRQLMRVKKKREAIK